ncbi:TetR/AcrR family transcriptional regulator [uncultured Fusobacterium sp.]|uniref:TetR/AcrR family transcriptional regulator n=1 Tax=uncultured Fusobacterium sp. TaxID=159267 RepID=UPI0025FBFA12|nr:TetR/AcrR family transcriptional regulator [uncultured Fusobacterium sp.]
MSQKSKSMIVRFKILQTALNEFANYSYEKSSINRICTDGNISKGVMYHHFKDKDELYLLCVRYCYDTMLDYYKSKLKDNDDWREEIKNFLDIRYHFFRENPLLQKIFFNTLLKMPDHLKGEIKKITKSLDELNYQFSMKILKKIKIRHGLKPEEIIFLLDAVQNMLNEKFYGKAQKSEEIEEISQEYDRTAEKWIDIMLYGILER